MEEDFATGISNVPRVSVTTRCSNEIKIRLARDITDADDFAEELMALARATEHDLVKMDIMSYGGSIDTAIMMRRAMNECNANIVGWIGPTCSSAATAIALQCDGWEVDEMSAFMIHTGSFGAGRQKARDVQAAVDHTVKQIERFVRLVYTGFLTEEEILRVLDGKDIWIESEELIQRLEAFAEYRESQGKEVVDEQRALTQKALDELEAQE